MISIFDSLSHPTISGMWVDNVTDASFKSLQSEMDKNDIISTCAVGLPGIGNYDHYNFIKLCEKYQSMVPIAGYYVPDHRPNNTLLQIKKYGFYGIKLHPKYSNFDLNSERSILKEIFNECYELGLVVFLCTYTARPIEYMNDYDPYFKLISILKETEKVKLVLLHGGLHRVFEYADIARFNSNILIDISYLLMKYQKSSLDNDIIYLFNTFDKKICVGSDHPEFSLKETRDRLEVLSQDIPINKKENYYYKNLTSFLNVPR